ncbi:hypothetical protein FH063_000062 [Azospirillum argentinense]|uniref:Uncharacterized protein n=1 Tax=Azospirillum argentinense TaxID=2970906 RepID=A0A5B0KZ16_9PROT|nr:hypothetical protein FH063_000062 [Azospirillum argentinense]
MRGTRLHTDCTDDFTDYTDFYLSTHRHPWSLAQEKQVSCIYYLKNP